MPMNDYSPAIARRVLPSGVPSPRGPVISPITRPDIPMDQVQALKYIANLLETLPYRIIDELRKQTSVHPRSQKPFVAPGLVTSIAAGDTIVLASFTAGSKDAGFLTHVGLASVPPASMPNLEWSIAMNGARNPSFASRRFPEPIYSPPLPVEIEIASSRKVELIVKNTSAAAINVYAVLVGWTEFLGDNNRWGGTPENGIG